MAGLLQYEPEDSLIISDGWIESPVLSQEPNRIMFVELTYLYLSLLVLPFLAGSEQRAQKLLIAELYVALLIRNPCSCYE